MRSLASVCVNDNLASGESGVPVGTSDYEFAGRVHMQYEVSLEQLSRLRRKRLYEHRQKNLRHIFADFGLHGLINALLPVLGHRVCI